MRTHRKRTSAMRTHRKRTSAMRTHTKNSRLLHRWLHATLIETDIRHSHSDQQRRPPSSDSTLIQRGTSAIGTHTEIQDPGSGIPQIDWNGRTMCTKNERCSTMQGKLFQTDAGVER